MIKLMELPYNIDALEPYISRQTIGFHYLKHHKGYVEKLNKLISGTEFETMTLEEIIINAHKKTEHLDIYHNAAQVWNHNFYWQSLNPDGGEPNKKLLVRITILKIFSNKKPWNSLAADGLGWQKTITAIFCATTQATPIIR